MQHVGNSIGSDACRTLRENSIRVSALTSFPGRFRDLVEIMSLDLGGMDLLSEGQKQLIRRAATLSVMAEAIEADVVRDKDFDILDYGTVCDRLRSSRDAPAFHSASR